MWMQYFRAGWRDKTFLQPISPLPVIRGWSCRWVEIPRPSVTAGVGWVAHKASSFLIDNFGSLWQEMFMIALILIYVIYWISCTVSQVGWVKTLKMFSCMISIVEWEVIYSLLICHVNLKCLVHGLLLLKILWLIEFKCGLGKPSLIYNMYAFQIGVESLLCILFLLLNKFFKMYFIFPFLFLSTKRWSVTTRLGGTACAIGDRIWIGWRESDG